jgi:hypothetical protein
MFSPHSGKLINIAHEAEWSNAILRQNALTSWAGLTSLTAMALHHVAVNPLDRVPTVVSRPEKKRLRIGYLLKLSDTGSLPEVKDEDMQRFKRQYGLWF